MATFAKVRVLPSALVLAFVFALSLAGTGVAHATPRTTTKAAVPQTCVWNNDPDSPVVFPLGSVDGWEEVEAQTYSCNSNDHRGVFEIGINKGEGGFCDEAVVDVVELYHEGIAVQHAVPQPATKFIGDPNDSCAGGNTFVLVTNTFTGPDDHLYCTDTTGISWDGIAQNNITNNYENAPCSDYIGSYPTL